MYFLIKVYFAGGLVFCFVGWLAFFPGEALVLAPEFFYKIDVTEINKRGISGKANLEVVLSFTWFLFVCHSIV